MSYKPQVDEVCYFSYNDSPDSFYTVKVIEWLLMDSVVRLKLLWPNLRVGSISPLMLHKDDVTFFQEVDIGVK